MGAAGLVAGSLHGQLKARGSLPHQISASRFHGSTTRWGRAILYLSIGFSQAVEAVSHVRILIFHFSNARVRQYAADLG